MSHNNFNEDRLKELLSRMPAIEDKQNKDQLFNRISSKLDQNKQKVYKKKHIWVIPSIASIAVVFILVFLIQGSFPNNMMYESSDMANDESGSEESTMESADIAINDEDSGTSAGTEEAEIEESDTQLRLDVSSKVAYDENSNSIFIHTAVMNENSTFIIPITLIDSNSSTDLNEYYNQIGMYINENEWGVIEFPFDDITFNILEAENQVILGFPENYEFPNGSTYATMFETILSHMFAPYQINEVILEPYNSNNEELGMFGDIDSFILEKPVDQSYKLFHNDYKDFLVPTPEAEYDNINDAFIDMQSDETDYNLRASIPKDMIFTVDIDGNQLIFNSSNELELTSQDYVNMVEAILATTKSFDYSSVLFSLPVKEIPGYDLRNPIMVPEGVNPIYIN
ncbi:hypothetical protein GH741_06665 [Aquibacillus halophilus]|uniref:GerMN domain-containing protein n=1 Tax=Aquibacillus halophilus TaxID=930132 RepID=A0A6A8D9B7_9BACI|nr:hypothetical protein [Aquibacillus halophilus]MRH42363.1 hypothetical protein [Aquibacillus halophilus]